jgi:hypothetical protein
MDTKRGPIIQMTISPELDEKLLQYQGTYMIEKNLRISKAAVAIQALEEFLQYRIDKSLDTKEPNGK